MNEKHLHVLVIGLSGSGKTYLSKFFLRKGKKAYDADEIKELAIWTDSKGNPKKPTKKEWLEQKDLKWTWKKRKLKQLLSKNKELYLFGLADNTYDFIKLFDKVYYLKADKTLITKRLTHKRRENDFGKTKKQREMILGWVDYSDKRAKDAGLTLLDASLSPQQIFDIICDKTKGGPTLLDSASKDVAKFLYDITKLRLAPPRVIFSTKVRDSAWYSNSGIYINPDYNPENLDYDEMIAHEFFHHVQTKMHPRFNKGSWESPAMFFAAAYMNRKYKSKTILKNRMINYLNQKEHTPKGGNKYVLSIFKQNKYDIKKTLSALLK